MRLDEKVWLETGGPQPQDDLELSLCALYHCTPGELDQQDYHRIQRQLVCLGERLEMGRWPILPVGIPYVRS